MISSYRFLRDTENEQKIVKQFSKGSPTEQLLASVMQAPLSNEQLLMLEKDTRLSKCNNQIAATFYFILASHYKVFDKRRWLTLLRKANQLQASSLQVDIRIELECFAHIKQQYADYAGFSMQKSSQKPVFVIGMRRSGTTLVESILGNHSDVFAAGESTLIENMLADIN